MKKKPVFVFGYLVAILCIAGLTACKPTLDTVSKTENPNELRTIAQTENISIGVQTAAIEKLGQIDAMTLLEQMVRYPGGEDHAFRSRVLQVLGNKTNYIETSTNQEILALIAISNRSDSVRTKALNRITDPLTLLTVAEHPLWKSNPTQITALFNNPEMQKQLYGIADNSSHSNKIPGRILAIKYLTDMSAVEMLLNYGRVLPGDVSLQDVIRQRFAELIDQVSDEGVITKFATTRSYSKTIINILQKKLEAGAVKNQALLLKIATRGRDRHLVTAAINKITDQDTLAQIAINVSKDGAATDRVTDPVVLAKIAKSAHSKDVRLHALKRITDKNVLAEIAISDESSNVTLAAVGRIGDQEVLTKIAKSDASHYKVALAASRKINDRQTLFQIATAAHHVSVINDILERLNDPELRLEFARSTQIESLALRFVKKTNDPEVLTKFLETAKSMEARLAAADKFLQLKFGKIKGALRRKYGGYEPVGVLLQLIILDKGVRDHYGELTMAISQRFDEPRKYGRPGEYSLVVEHITITIKNSNGAIVAKELFSGDAAKGSEKFYAHVTGGSNTNFAKINTTAMCQKVLKPLPDQVRKPLLKITSTKYKVGNGCSTL